VTSGLVYRQDNTYVEQYVFKYGATYTGSFTTSISYLDSSAYANFANLGFTIWAGQINDSSFNVINADNVKYNTRAEITIQTQDAYGNTIEDTSGGRYLDENFVLQTYSNVTQAYIVVVYSANGLVPTYYWAGYCAKSKTEPKKCPTSYLQENDRADWEADVNMTNGVKTRPLFDTDKTLYSDGFFRVFFNVPQIVFGDANYTVEVYRINTQTTSDITAWSGKVGHSSSVLVKSYNFKIAPSNDGDNGAIQVNLAVVIGAAAGCFFITGVGYGAFRLGRYRPKYKVEKARADENEQVLDEMRDEGNLAGGRDYMAVGNAVVTLNPLHEAYQLDINARKQYAMEKNPALRPDSANISTDAAPFRTHTRGAQSPSTASSRGTSEM
jgi:hypothetical protein